MTMRTTWLVLGSGWHLGLFKAEVESLTGEDLEELTPRVLCVGSADRLEDAATVDGTLMDWSSSDISGIETSFSTWLHSSDLDPACSVAIRWERHGERASGVRGIDLARVMGGILSDSGFSIDLESPQQVVRLLISGEQLFWGIPGMESPPRLQWKERVATARPFFKPVSLDPRQARLMVNLCGARGPLLDPMCGTGGLLIEAATSGLQAVGVDLDPEMIAGSKENLEWCGVDAELVCGDATRLSEIGMTSFKSVCFDPPYGRNAWRSEKSDMMFQRVLISLRQVVAEDCVMCCMLPSTSDGELIMGESLQDIGALFRESGWLVDSSWFIPVHASLGRWLMRASPLLS